MRDPLVRGALMAAVVTVAVGGCVPGADAAKEPNRVDFVRAQALLDDPWLASSDVSMTGYQAGSNDLYTPTIGGSTHEVRGTPEMAVLAEVAAARRVGWRPFYGQCPGAATQGDVSNRPAGGLQVLLARGLPDGTVLLASVLPDDDTVIVLASSPNHAAPPAEAPTPVDLTDLACFSDDHVGLDVVGTDRDVTEPS